jgi:DNA-binding winged helix-turn-helix (wHTH) protein/TolB-like protein/Tfp pilus assembly protein PilF
MTAPRPPSYAFEAFRLDAGEKILFQHGQPVPLTPKAVETLLALVERHGHLVTKDELLRIVWPDTFVEENNLAQNISLLRRVLGEGAGGRPFIETIPKRGYRFVGPVVEAVDAEDGAVRGPAAEPAIVAPPERDVTRESNQSRSALRRAAVWSLIAAVAVTFLFVARSRIGPRSPRTTATPLSTPAAAAVRLGPAGVTRIAVLPFVNLGSPAEEYFAAGMTEEIASRLAGVSRLAVKSSTTVARYARRGKSVPGIGADLGVEYVVEGSVRSEHAPPGMQVRITPKLIRVADDTAVWTHQYDAPLSDVFGVQADIAYQITGALQVALEAGERRMVEAHATADTEAHLAYLRGMTAFQQGASDTSNQAQARADLEAAVARDPRFALAWSWLARVYAAQYNYGAQRRPEIKQAAQRAARTAIDLDPGLAEGHMGLAQVLLLERDYDQALRELEIARAGLPNSPELFRLSGFVEQRRGRWPEALAVYTRGFDLDPPSMAEAIAVHHLYLRQYREAGRFIAVAKAGHRAAAVVPEAWMLFSESGDVAAARRVLEPALAARSPADARVRGLLARLEWFDGRHRRALDLIEEMDPAGAWLPPEFRFPASLAAGQVYESMGRREAAAKRYAAAMADLEHKQGGAPEDYQIEAALGLAAAGLGRAAEAVRHGERAVALLPVTRDAGAGPLFLFVLAQIHARLGQQGAAFATLDQMFSVPGFYNVSWVQRDPGFAALRRDAGYPAHIARWSSQKGEVALLNRRPSPR